jgi:inosine-uridine nucleoside N-ribohydrolase
MLVVYKRILETQPDHSVTIVTVGHPHALALLMDDADGIKLLCKKVQKCVLMTGADVKPSKSWNFTENGVAPYTRKILANFSAPMYFSPYGTTVITGNRLLPATPADNPVREAYRLWNNALNTGRMSWDHIAVIYAVEPQLFDEDTVGELVMTDDNKIYWNKNANNVRHIKVTPKITDEELSQKIETMMTIPPLVKAGEAHKVHE